MNELLDNIIGRRGKLLRCAITTCWKNKTCRAQNDFKNLWRNDSLQLKQQSYLQYLMRCLRRPKINFCCFEGFLLLTEFLFWKFGQEIWFVFNVLKRNLRSSISWLADKFLYWKSNSLWKKQFNDREQQKSEINFVKMLSAVHCTGVFLALWVISTGSK